MPMKENVRESPGVEARLDMEESGSTLLVLPDEPPLAPAPSPPRLAIGGCSVPPPPKSPPPSAPHVFAVSIHDAPLYSILTSVAATVVLESPAPWLGRPVPEPGVGVGEGDMVGRFEEHAAFPVESVVHVSPGAGSVERP